MTYPETLYRSISPNSAKRGGKGRFNIDAAAPASG